MSTQARITTDHDQSLCLSVSSRAGEQKVFALDKNHIIIGRETDCEIVLADSSISKRHATVTFDNGVTTINDGSNGEPSSNGVYINGRKIEGPMILNEGDEVSLGVFQFEVVSAAVIRESIPISNIRSEGDLIRFLEKGTLTDMRDEDLLDILSSLALSADRRSAILGDALDHAMSERHLKRFAIIARVKTASERLNGETSHDGLLSGKPRRERSTLMVVAAFAMAVIALGVVIIWGVLS